MRLLLVGHGRMGRLVESHAPHFGCEIAACLNGSNNAGARAIRAGDFMPVEVAIDFSTAAAVPENFTALAARGVNLVIGTTGWQADEARLRQAAQEAGIGVVAAPNFSPGVLLFQAVVESAARLFKARPDFGAWIHEIHHLAKRDAPSGTARLLLNVMREAGYEAAVDVASTRAGSVPGTHTIGFDGAFETITLEHAARDRTTFAQGALEAARWVRGRAGWFTMRDVLGLADAGSTSPNRRDRP